MKKFEECGASLDNFNDIIGQTADNLREEIENLRKNSTNAQNIGDEIFINFLFDRFLKRDYPFKME